LKEKNFCFTLEEEAVINGTLLGDAHLNRRGPNSFRLKVEQGGAQKEYAEWKREKLIRLCEKNQPVSPVYDSKKRSTSWRFYTDSGLRYKKFHELFYTPVSKGGKISYVKSVTPDLIQSLPKHPALLATLFMDDGSVRNDAYSVSNSMFPFTAAKTMTRFLKRIFWNSY